MKNWMLNALSSNKKIAIPIMTHPGIEMIDRSVYDAVTNGNIHFEAILALDKKYPSGACTVIMDLTVEAEAFGAQVLLPENEIPTVTDRLVFDFDSVNKLQIPTMGKGRIKEYLLANRLAANHITNKPIFGGAIGPFSLAGRLFGLSEFMIACYCEPEIAKLLLKKCSIFLKNYCIELKKQGIILAEPAAGLLSNEGCDEFSSIYIKPIVEAVQDENFIIVLHNCGNTGQCTPAMLNTGSAAYHFGNRINMITALEQCPSDVLVMGNIDPVSVFTSSTPENIKNIVTDLLIKTEGYSNFILSSDCDIPPHVAHENIEAFYQALEEYNQNK